MKISHFYSVDFVFFGHFEPFWAQKHQKTKKNNMLNWLALWQAIIHYVWQVSEHLRTLHFFVLSIKK